MKIAVFHNLPVGGAKRVLYEQVKYLSKKYYLEVFEYEQKEIKIFNLGDLAKVNKFESGINSSDERLKKDFKAFYTLRKTNQKIAKIINNNFDLCLVHTDSYIEAPYLLRYLKIPSLFYDQELSANFYSKDFKFIEKVSLIKNIYEKSNRLFRKIIDQQNMRFADKIATNSVYMQKNLKKFYNLDSEVIYPAVDTKIFKNYKKNRKGFLFVGNKSKFEGWKFVENIKNIKTLKKDGNTFEIDNDKKLAEVYSQAIATLCTNPVEAFGLKAIESMACGTPVIALNEAAYPEIVKNNFNGYLADRVSFAKYAKKITNLSKTDYQKMSKNCIKTAKSYTWKKHNQKLESMLLSLTNG